MFTPNLTADDATRKELNALGVKWGRVPESFEWPIVEDEAVLDRSQGMKAARDWYNEVDPAQPMTQIWPRVFSCKPDLGRLSCAG